tara:strand:- start:12399 stop:13286 length:888 start_codon:yes stop_codon:yes gene_type:complete
MIFLIHIYRCLKRFLKFPIQFSKNLLNDLKKDYFSNSAKSQRVLVLGLPKSGTTMIERILDELGYVNQTISSLRLFDIRNLKHHHDLSAQMLSLIPKNKNTFLKRHTEASKRNLDLIRSGNFKVIVSIRNLLDVMISRYLHMISDKSLPQYNLYKDLNYIDGFKKSLIINHRQNEIPINIFENWIENWLKEINQNKSKYCLLNYDDYKRDNLEYYKKIFHFLNLDTREAEAILQANLIHEKKLKNQSLEKNLKTNLNAQTFNKNSSKVREIIKSDNDAITFYNSKVKNEKHKYKF